MALERNGQVDEGIVDLGVYIHRHPTSSLAYTKRGVRYIWKGDLENAEKDLARAIALNPKNAEAHDDLGVIYAQRRDYEKAVQHFQATIRGGAELSEGLSQSCDGALPDRTQRAGAGGCRSGVELIPDARDSLLLKSAILDALGPACRGADAEGRRGVSATRRALIAHAHSIKPVLETEEDPCVN